MDALPQSVLDLPYMPHGMCYLWTPQLLWLHVISDSLVALSYFAIPPALVYLVWRARAELAAEGRGSRGLPYDWMFLAFGIFVLACGTTHAIEVWTVWVPHYWISGGAKVVTAAASLATAIALPPLVPRALDLLRSARAAERHRIELEDAHAELRAVYRQLSEADRLKTEFFANVSHELRTPLTLILGPTDQLLQEGDLDAHDRDRLLTVQRNALHLLAHVDDLLEASELEAGAAMARYVDTDVPMVVEQVVGHFRALAEERGIELGVSVPSSMPATLDRSKTERILLNLLSNAFKFTPRGGVIRIAARAVAGGDPASVEIVVEDDGPGVPEHLREVIFERFRQGDEGDARVHGGTGLGLAICREFAAAMGGSIEAGASPMGGASFRVLLPLEPPAGETLGDDGTEQGIDAGPILATLGGADAATEKVEPDVEADDDRPRVLIIDDNADMRNFLSGALGRRFACSLAPDAATGLARALEAPPDLIVTDLMMPGMSGEQLVGRVRQERRLDSVPILVLTARADATLPAALLEGGAQDYIVKPVRIAELEARIANLLSQSSARSVMREELGDESADLVSLSHRLADRKRELERAVEEKQVLLRELHHRVKGNLQTVTSLLRLQLRSATDRSAVEALRDSQARVAAIGLLHEKLYQPSGSASVELDDYLRRLASLIRDTRDGDGPVTVDLELDPIRLGIDQALPCGLLAHELICHALEIDRSLGGEGRVQVEVGRAGPDVVLRVGAARGVRVEPAGDSGLRMELAEALSRQLRGSLARAGGAEGLAYEVRFRLDEGERAA